MKTIGGCTLIESLREFTLNFFGVFVFGLIFVLLLVSIAIELFEKLWRKICKK